jgi:hypothetical protein
LINTGYEKLHKGTTTYIRSLSKTELLDSKTKTLPVAALGQALQAHGEDFEPDSEFGNCLIAMGRAEERIARTQEVFTAQAMATWVEGLERSLAGGKEYQVCAYHSHHTSPPTTSYHP